MPSEVNPDRRTPEVKRDIGRDEDDRRAERRDDPVDDPAPIGRGCCGWRATPWQSPPEGAVERSLRDGSGLLRNQHARRVPTKTTQWRCRASIPTLSLQPIRSVSRPRCWSEACRSQIRWSRWTSCHWPSCQVTAKTVALGLIDRSAWTRDVAGGPEFRMELNCRVAGRGGWVAISSGISRAGAPSPHGRVPAFAPGGPGLHAGAPRATALY